MSSAAFHEIQYKASSGQVNLDQAQGIVECFVAGIGNKDSVGDVCATGAFTKSLMRRKPRVVWGHNWNDPIGKVIEIYEVPASDPRLPAKMKAAGIGGLYAKVQFNLNSEKGREAFANVAFFGEEQEWSIGYKTLRAQFDPNVQANILYEVELYEVSPVLHGANQLTGTISVKSDEKGGMMPMVITPVGQPSDDERPMQEEMERKLEEELSMRLGSPVKVLKTDSGVVYFTRQDSDSENSKYKCRYHMGDDGVFMFGKPERFEIPRQMPSQQPVQRTQPGMPSRPMSSTPGTAPVVVPNLVPGATPASPPMVRFNYDGEDAPSSSMPVKPKLVDEERDLAEALIKITKRYGKFNEDSTGVWAGYKPAAENPVAKIGVKCSNCVLYEGNGKCKIVAQQVEPEGKCRFAVIPDGVVSMGPVQKASFDASSGEEEVKWLEEIEEKYPGEFVSGILRGTLKRRRKRKLRSKTVFMLSEYSEKSLDDFSDFDMAEISYVLPIDPDKAFEVKQLIDPIIDFHRVDAYVEDGGIVFTNGVTHDFVEAVGAAVNGPFFQSEKALGRNLAGKFQRGRSLSARFDPYAWDGDNDGIIQEGTPFQRPAIPGLNDFASRGRINLAAARKIQGQWNASEPDRGGTARATDRADLPAISTDTSLASGKSSNPTARRLDEIIDGHDDKWDLDKTDQEFSDYLDTLDPDETADALAEIQQQQRINEAQAREAGVLEDDVVGDDFTSIVNRLMSDYDMDEFDAEEEGARLLDSYDEYRRRREHYLTAAKAAKRRMRGSGAIRNATSRDALSSGKEDERKLRINREVFEKRVVFGLSLEEVAEEMGMTRAEVRQAEMRHLDRIRNMKGDEFNEEVYRLRQEAYSLEDAAKAFGKSREEIRQAEMKHSAKLRDLPEAEKDAAIFRDRTQNDINGRQMSLDEVAKKYGVSVDEARRSELREAKRQRDLEQTRPRREIRRERNASGTRAAQGGPDTPPRFSKSVFDKYDEERKGLLSGKESDWLNPTDGLPLSMTNWTDDDWDTYYSREMIQRERISSRPLGEDLGLGYGFREDLSGTWDKKSWFAYTSDLGAASVYETEDGKFTAVRWEFDDYKGYYADEPYYEFKYQKEGFESPEEAADWLSNEIDGEGGRPFIYGSDRDAWSKVKSPEEAKKYYQRIVETGDSDREKGWADYYANQYPDGISMRSGLSSGKGPYTAGQRITRQINKKRPPRTDYDYSGDGKYLPTEEQMTAIDAVMTGENVVIPALAGSGKTSTLVSLAKRMAKEQPDKKLVYLAFNRSAANDAERRFRGIPNVQVMTLDSVGRRWMSQRKNGKSFIDRIGSEDIKAGKELTAKNLAKEFKLNTEVVQGREVSGDQIASLAINAVEKFEISGDDSIGLQHFVDDKDQQIPADQLPSNVFDVANRLWNDKTSEDGEFLISYNTLTKMWQSSNPDFASAGTGPDGAKDLVLFDESQDLNPVWNKAASAMSIQRVYVGDPNQAIYGFRGAVNELDSISEKEPYVLPLTEVFRFGPEIASVGNRVLSLLGIDSNRMVGRGGAGSVVDSGSMENPDLIIARTNGGVIRSALEMIDNGKSIGTTQRAKKELDLMINSISRLRFNNPTGQDHPDLAEFTSFDDLKKAVEEKVANRKQSTLYRLMTEISLTDLRRVQKGMQVWDPADDGETAKDSEIVDLALSAAKDDPKIGDMIRSIASQFGKRELSPKQWAVLERASGKKREGGQPVMGLDIKKPSSISPGASGKLTSNIDYNVVGDRVELSGRGTMGAKEQIKAAGFRWDGTKKVWHTPSSRADEAFDQLSGGGGATGKKATKPDVIILTSHLSKGLEMDNVKLANDFWGPERDEETGETVWPDEEHMHAVYVALTRAKKSLDPGGADWVFDWTDDSDGDPNTSREFGLSSGKKAAKKMQRRPWTEEERQAFADGQRLRAQTIQGKRRGSAPDDMRDAGRAGGRRERRGLSSGKKEPSEQQLMERAERERRAETGSTEMSRSISAGDKSKEKLAEASRAPKADDLEASNTGFEDTGETSAPTTRRRAAGGTRVGAGETARQEFGKISTDENGNEVFTPDPNVKERIRAGKKKKSIKIKNISDNDKRNPGDEWLVDASKLREVFTDSSGKQLSDEMIADLLGISVDDVKEWYTPGAGVSETEVSDMIEKAKGVRDLAQLMPEDVVKVWGYDAAPGWIDSQTGEKISRPEFESMQRAGNLRGIQPYTEYDLITEDELANAKPIEQIRQERLVREVSKRSNYSATTLARSLGVIGESDRLDDSNADAFIEKLRELGIDAQPRTIKETWVTGGMPLQALRQLEGDGHISIPDVYKMESSPSTIAKIDATQSVVDALEKAGLNETQIGRVINYWTGTRNPTALKKHREAMEKGGKARTGAEGSLGRNDLQQRIDEANKIIKENGFNVPELSVDSIMGKPTSADAPEVDATAEPSSPPKFVPLPRDPRGNYDFGKFSDKEIADQVSARKYYIRQLQNAEKGLSGQKLKEARARRGRYQSELNALEMVATRRLASRRTRAPKSQSEKSLQALDNVSFRKQKAEENTHGRTKGARAMGSKRLVSL